ncbi:MAG: hypothetical protein AAGK17_03600 [Pseudomonadota bacterium]
MASTAPYFGLLDRIVRMIDRHPKRALLSLPILSGVAIIAFAFWQGPALIGAHEARKDREYREGIMREERERRAQAHAIEVDEMVRRRLLDLRLRSSSSRAVIRALVLDIDHSEQIIEIVDVFESMDIRTEETGLRTRPLPLSAIRRSLNYMLASDVPRCIARNVEEQEDPELKAFMHAGDLKASVACPLRTLDGRPIGLLSVSIRTPIEENDLVKPMTRDAALELGAILTEAASFKAAIMRKKENGE